MSAFPTSARWRRALRLAGIGALLLLSLAVRLPHLGWGLPDVEEEALPAKKAFEMWGWDEQRLQLDPGTAGWPSLSFHVHLALQAVQRAVGGATGRYASPLDFYVEYRLDPSPVMLWARGLSVALSLVLVVAAVGMGTRLAGTTGAAVAGLLVALSPMLVRHSQMVEPDMLLSVFAALSTWRLLSVLERGRTRDYVVCAALAGLGAAAKYTPVLLALSLYAVHLQRRRREGHSLRWLGLDDPRLGWAALACVLAFCVASPYTFANLDVLRRDVAYQLMHMSEGHFGHADQGIGYGHYLFEVLPRALGWPALLAGVAGLVVAWRRRDAAPALVWALLPYFVVMGSLSTQFDRYMMPLLVPLAVAAGVAVDAARRRWWSSRRGALAITGLVLATLVALPIEGTARYHRVQSEPSTQRAATDWIVANMPADETTLAMERYGPNLPLDERLIERRRPVFERLSPEQQERLLARPFYRVVTIPMYATRVGLTAYYYDLRHFVAYDAIVVSGAVRNRYRSQPERFPRQMQFYEDLDRFCEVLAEFDPAGRARGPEIVVYGWREDGRERLEAERGVLGVDHWRAFTDQVHAPDFLSFVESIAVHAENEQAWDVATVYYEILSQTADPGARLRFLERAGITAISADQLDRAERLFHDVLLRDPEAVLALGNLGLVAERRGDLDEAASWYERTIRADREGTARRWATERLRAVRAPAGIRDDNAP